MRWTLSCLIKSMLRYDDLVDYHLTLTYVGILHLIVLCKFQESKVSIGLRHIVYVIKKDENKWWSRLLKQEGKPPVFLKVDWDKWVDEDEEEGK